MTFQPGNKGGGKRREKQGFDALMLEMKAAEDIRGMRVIVRKLLDMAALGDITAIREVLNRIDGMPVQQIDQNVEITRYVAELPPALSSTDEWLKQTTPKLQ